MERKKFKTESKRLLDLMINSIYTNREIFLRELLSNASDAIDKYHFLSLNNTTLSKVEEYQIKISLDKDERMIAIEDNGIGMTYDELVENLGTIASSGSAKFMEKLKENEENKNSDVNIIGQFGVGFYSAFMVGKKITVETKSAADASGYRFTSDGEESYTIEKIEKPQTGTIIKVYLRENKEDENYDDFLEEYYLQDLVKKYSDYIRYPIKMLVEETEPELDAEGKEIPDKSKTVYKVKVLNSMVPLWKKNKSEVSKEQMDEFYKDKFFDMQAPFHSCFFAVEGLISYSSILFVPGKAPYDLYSEKYEKGLQLYTKGVMIMDKCKDLIPDYLKFVKGVVDSADLSLNISREMLQQNAQLHKIAASIEKKLLSEFETIKKNDYKKYLEFFKIYGAHLKFGVYEDYGKRKDLLKELLIYPSLNNEEMISLEQYVSAMKEEQKYIYFASGKDKKSVLTLPQLDMIKKHSYDCLILTDDIDEFVLMMLGEYTRKKFKNITEENFDEISEEEKKNIDDKSESSKQLLTKLTELLHGEVDEVRLSSHLVDSPVCLVNKGGISFEMEKVLSKTPEANAPKATRILEINPHHELLKAITKVFEEDPESLQEFAEVLYSQALLIEGLPLKDPNAFTKSICALMIKAAK